MSYQTARANMVESQVRTNKVTDPVLIEALSTVPRELFVPAGMRGIAYVDEDLDLGAGRCLMEPMVLARLLQTAAVTPQDTLLEVGCGTGYGVALAARLAGRGGGGESAAAHVPRGREPLGAVQGGQAENGRGPAGRRAPGRRPVR